MSPRKTAAEAGKTRERILDQSVAVASVEGLQGLTLGRLAGDLGMSKAGVIGHFGSKEALQLATLDRGYAHFSRIVLDPVAGRPPGLARLRAIFDGWLQYLVSEREIFPGGCLFSTAAVEFDGRHGPVRDAVTSLFSGLCRELSRDLQAAVDAGDLPASIDAEQILFELLGIFSSLNLAVQLFDDPGAPDRARRGLDRILGAPPDLGVRSS
jgi:AcrR family transcriptional regulator